MIAVCRLERGTREEIFANVAPCDDAQVTAAVAEILERVRTQKDEALRAYTERFDGACPQQLRVTESEWEAGMRAVSEPMMRTLRLAADNIETFHRRQATDGFEFRTEQGVVMGQRVLPLARVGIYVPGGTANYPSTVLMNAIPARIAGVREIVMTTPVKAGGSVKPEILAAAKIAGVTEIYKVGGAQAIAALAYGTQSIAPVDKITGPGNIYVATAKRLVYGTVDIDMIAGPSEILIVADDSADPIAVAADMLSQAEHDVRAAAALVTDSASLAEQVARELERQIPLLDRTQIARKSIDDYGKIFLTESLRDAYRVADWIAPEHLELCVRDAMHAVGCIRNAGSIFVGHYTPEPLGDYLAGPNHTLPTGGTARFASPLGVQDFVKRSSYLCYTPQALAAVGEDAMRFAMSEGLQAHANAVRVRLERNDE